MRNKITRELRCSVGLKYAKKFATSGCGLQKMLGRHPQIIPESSAKKPSVASMVQSRRNVYLKTRLNEMY